MHIPKCTGNLLSLLYLCSVGEIPYLNADYGLLVICSVFLRANYPQVKVPNR